MFRSLVEHGYDCVPVNPKEETVLGIAAYPTLVEAAAATGPFDIVDVFRRSELVCRTRMKPSRSARGACGCSSGIVNWEAASIARDAGLVVVMDRCTAIEVGRVGGRR